MSQSSTPEVVISGVGVVTHGYEGSRPLDQLGSGEVGPSEEEVTPGLVIPVGRLGRLRRHPFRHRFEKMSQLDAFGQYAFVAAGHALDDGAMPAPDPAFEGAGVILGTAFGCQEANYRFDQFDLDPDDGLFGARPVVFKNTVDNVPAGWASVAYRLRGVNATFTSGPGAGAEAILAAMAAIEQRRARQVVAGGVERVIPLQLAALHRTGELPAPYPAEGAAVVVLELAAAAYERGHRPRARLAGGLRCAASDHIGLRRWLSDLGSAPEGIALASLVAATPEGREAARTALEAAGLSGPFLVESETTGETFAAQGPLALALMVERLARRPASEPAVGLVHVTGEGDDTMVFLVEASTRP